LPQASAQARDSGFPSCGTTRCVVRYSCTLHMVVSCYGKIWERNAAILIDLCFMHKWRQCSVCCNRRKWNG